MYGVLPAPVGLGLALAVGALATSLAVRWGSQGVAALGILGGLLSPVLAGAPWDGTTMAILLIAAASAVGVLLSLRWDWLAFGVFLITVPQWIAFLAEGRPVHAIVAVLAGFGLVGAVAAVGHELRVGAAAIRPSSAFLLSLNAVALAVGGWLALSAGEETVARLWLVALAAVHLGIGLVTVRSGRTSHGFGLLALVLGAVLADVALLAVVEGPARALGWAGASMTLATLLRGQHRRGARPDDEALTALGLGAHVTLALLQSVTSDASPALLAGGGPVALGGAVSLAGVAAACLVSARLAASGRGELRVGLDVVGLAVLAYLTALALDGALLTLAWSVEAVLLARLAWRTGDEVAACGARAHVLIATVHALAVEAPLSAIADGVASPLQAAVALVAIAFAAAVSAHLTGEGRPGIRGSLEATAMAAPAYLAAIVLDDPALVVALAAGAVILAEVARGPHATLAAHGALVHLGAALLHVLAFEAPPTALVSGVEEPAAAAASLTAVVLATVACARRGAGPTLGRHELLGAAAVTTLYLASVLVVTPFQPGSPADGASLLAIDVRQQGQVLLSVLWSLVGLGALVFGLRRDLRLVRLGALALLLTDDGRQGVPVRPRHAHVDLPGRVVHRARALPAHRGLRVAAHAATAASRPAPGAGGDALVSASEPVTGRALGAASFRSSAVRPAPPRRKSGGSVYLQPLPPSEPPQSSPRASCVGRRGRQAWPGGPR